jgi:hypothetical protein
MASTRALLRELRAPDMQIDTSRGAMLHAHEHVVLAERTEL